MSIPSPKYEHGVRIRYRTMSKPTPWCRTSTSNTAPPQCSGVQFQFFQIIKPISPVETSEDVEGVSEEDYGVIGAADGGLAETEDRGVEEPALCQGYEGSRRRGGPLQTTA